MGNKKSSLERSHSKTSNFKLTLLCILLSLGLSAIWAGTALLLAGFTYFGATAAAAGLVMGVLSFLAVGHFTR